MRPWVSKGKIGTLLLASEMPLPISRLPTVDNEEGCQDLVQLSMPLPSVPPRHLAHGAHDHRCGGRHERDNRDRLARRARRVLHTLRVLH